jgi:putative transposase
MTNHFHMVVKTPEPNLSRGMKWLLGTYVVWFNKRHGRTIAFAPASPISVRN